MRTSRLVSILVLSTVLSATAGHAKTLRDAEQPAEFPPRSYSGKQYVDSQGCIYVRAGVGDAVTWVPRVSRSRQVVCGYQPSLAGASQRSLPVISDPVAPAAPRTQTVAAPRPHTPSAPVRPAAAAVVAAPAVAVPAQRTNASTPWWKHKPSPAPEPTVWVNAPAATVATTTTASAAPRSSAAAPTAWWAQKPSAGPQPTVFVNASSPAPSPASAPAPQPQTVAVRSVSSLSAACPNAEVISKRYIGSGNRYAVRCGPQNDHPGSYGVGPAQLRPVQTASLAPSATAVTGTRNTATRIQVATGPAYTSAIPVAPVQIPKGYKAAWDDGRLNPSRGQGTALGQAQMAQVWTNTVPRQLVTGNTGRDVTLAATHQNLIQQRNGSQVSASSQRARTRVVKARAPATQAAAAAPTRNTTAPAAFRYVQVGTFGVPANAQATAARLQNMGLPVRFANFTQKGRPLKIVLAGPFSSQAQLNQALSSARRAGFKDAFFRK